MKELFGLPVSTLMYIFGGSLLAIVAWSLLLSLRQPVLFRLASRNIPRRWGRSLLIVLGLTLATTIIAAAMATGDTVAHSARSSVLTSLGNIDELVSARQKTDIAVTGESAPLDYFDAGYVDTVRNAAASNPLIDGVAPAIFEEVGAQNLVSRQTEPRVAVVGVDPAQMKGFGAIHSLDGKTIDFASLVSGEVMLNKDAAKELEAKAGDSITLYAGGTQRQVLVRDVVSYDGMGTTDPALLMTLSDTQSLFDKQGLIQHIIISNKGGNESGASHTNAVIDSLQPTVQSLHLAISPTKSDNLKAADDAGASFSTFFVTFGSFSIAAGILLIFLLFVMLAAERRPEMGIARAVGTERIHLVEMFMFEGLLYDLGAAAIGSLAGIGVAYFMVSVLISVIANFGVDIRFSFSTTSLITAYSMGVVVTFLVVTFSAWRVSVLNIVSAVRDLPEESAGVKGRASLVWFAIILGLGALLTYAGLSSQQGMPFYLGISLIILAFVPLLRWLGVNDRLVYTVAGGSIVVWWLLPWSTFDAILPNFSMDFNIWIVGGIVTVIGATWIVMYNSDLGVRGVMATLGRIGQMAPILKTALTYPLMNRFRTGVTLAMFTLVVFTLVVGGTTTTAFTRAFNDVKLYGGGFDLRTSTVAVNPISNLGTAIDQSGTLNPSDYDVIAAQSLVAVQAKQDGGSRDFGDYPLRGVDDTFLDNNTYGFSAIDPAYGSAKDVWAALKANPNLAVVDSLVAPLREHFDFGSPAPDFQLEGFYLEDNTFKATPIVLRDPQTGEEHKLTVIAILRDVVPTYMIGVTTSQRFVDAAFPTQATPTSDLIRLRPGVNVQATADNLESTFLANGLEATVLKDELNDIVSLNKTFNYLIQGFIGLGLVVGVAALGVISARAVVERRQEIGVMRAIGFEQGRVQLSFLIESSMVAVAGIVLGTVLGLVLAHNIIADAQSQPSWENVAFTVPWLNLAIIYAIVLGAALITAFIPARQASRVYPAQALRYE